MKAKILALALVLICLLALMPTVLAAPAPHGHYRGSFKRPVSSQAELMDTTGIDGMDSVYLTGNIKLESDLVVDRELELCLNGYSIDVGDYSILIGPKGVMSVYDCAEVSAGIISRGSSEMPMILNTGIYSHISGSITTESRTALLNKAEMNILGGLISGRADELVQTIGSAVFTFNGGEVRAKGSGVGVAMIAAPEDEGAKARDYNAGIAGGRVSAESGSLGAVVVNAPKGRFVLNGGAYIEGSGCPGVRVLSGKFDTYGGAYIASDSESAIVGTGGAVSLYFSTVNSREKYGVEISGDASLLLSGSQDINGGLAGVHLAEGKLFSMSDYGFYGDVRVSVHIENDPQPGAPVVISTPCDAKHYPHFLSANPHCTIKYENGAIYSVYDESVTHFHDVQNYVLPLTSGYADLSKNNFYLEGDLSMNGFYVGKTVNLCLNGHSLKLRSAIKLYPGSTLNIHDCVGGGSISSEGSCFTFLEGGNQCVVLNEGIIQSNTAPAIRLNNGGSIVVNGGEISTLTNGVCAVEVSGHGGSIAGRGGMIRAGGTAVVVNNSTLELEGSLTISAGDCAIQSAGGQAGGLIIGGSPVLEGERADIYLTAGSLITPKEGLAPAESYSVLSDTAPAAISLPSAMDHSASFASADAQLAVFCGEDKALRLEKALDISAGADEAYIGDSVSYSLEGAPEGAAITWYMRNRATGSAEKIEGAQGSRLDLTIDAQSGEYEIYCSVEAGESRYMGRAVKLSVLQDEIRSISVTQAQALEYSGEVLTPVVNASAETIRGGSVSFVYSADGENYSAQIPAFGPEGGEYTLYYRASAQGCEDVDGTLSILINQNVEPVEEKGGFSLSGDLRFYAIVALVVVFFLLCLVYIVVRPGRKKRR